MNDSNKWLCGCDRKIPHKRVYDDKRRKRLLFITTTTWQGISVGAKHYYVNIREDTNNIRCKNRYYHFSDDIDGNGFVLERQTFKSLECAKIYILGVLKKYPKHKPKFSGLIVL